MKNKRGWIDTPNMVGYLLGKFAWACLLLLLLQVIFFLCNKSIFEVDGLSGWMRLIWGNVVFGLATISTLLAPFLLVNLLPFNFRWKHGYRILSECLYVIPLVFMILACGCDVNYFEHTFRRLSGEIFNYLGVCGQMGSLFPHLIVDFWPSTVAVLLPIALLAWGSSKMHLAPLNAYQKHIYNDLAALVLGCLLCVVMMRGGFGKQALQPTDAGRFCDLKNSALVTNDAFNVLKTFIHPNPKEVEYMSQEEAQQIYPAHFVSSSLRNERENLICDYKGIFHPGAGFILPPPPPPGEPYDTMTYSQLPEYKNVVIIILESFSQEYMGCYNKHAEKSRTPFLDSLAQHSYVFQGRANGKKSIEGVPAVLAGMPTLMEEPFIESKYSRMTYTTLPQVLKRNGFTTCFFHGGYNGTMGFDTWALSHGFDRYLGMDEYLAEGVGSKKQDYDGCWGIFDEPFLQYMVRRLNSQPQPFFASVFTVSSHHPFHIPQQHKGEFEEGVSPLLKCVSYTDYALRQFFAAASKQQWYRNTLFVITADHPGYGLTKEYCDYGGYYRIPMIFFDPQIDEYNYQPETTNQIVQQIDLLPSVVDYLGLREEFDCFGNNLFCNHGDWHIVYGNGFYTLETSDGITAMEGYTWSYMGDPEHKDENYRFLKAVVQQYNNRLVRSEL